MMRTKRPWRRALALQALENRTVPALLINEVFVNPPATDDSREYVEIYNTAGAAPLTDIWLLEIEGDVTSGNNGTVDNAVDLSAYTTGTNGLLLIGNLYATNNATPWTTLVPTATKLADLNRPGATTIENGNATIMLVTNFTGTIGTDYDVDNDGVIETPPWSTIIDAVGWVEGPSPGKIYSPAALTQSSGTSDGVTRLPGTTAQTTASWYCGDIIAVGGTPDLGRDYDPIKCSPNLPSGGKITPGDVNFGPPPAPTVSGVQIQDGSDQRSIINTFKVTFSEAVTFPNGIATAFTLERYGPSGATGLVGLDLPVQVGNEVTLKVNNTGAINLNNHSLANGQYKLTVVASEVSGAGGKIGVNYELNTFRLYGDVNGDGTVSNNDFNVFRTSFGGSYFALDYDGDGSVSNSDFNAFRSQFGSTMP